VENAKKSRLDVSDARLKELVDEMNTIMKHRELMSREGT
jgi:Asp-tRNA(Asn)/Glu-tRNA(Gln) amidotransferase C subunit